MAEPEKKADETTPGGRYQGVDGSWHDANGNPLGTPEPAFYEVVETTLQEEEVKEVVRKKLPKKGSE